MLMGSETGRRRSDNGKVRLRNVSGFRGLGATIKRVDTQWNGYDHGSAEIKFQDGGWTKQKVFKNVNLKKVQ